MPKHGTVMKDGYCRDCASGTIGASHRGFEFWNEGDEEGRGHWFCRYCGSNHVTVRDGKTIIADQGDMYDNSGHLL